MSSTIESEPSEMPSLAERLSDPEVARSLNRLIDRAEQVDVMLDKAAEAQAAVPNLLATLVDLADSMSGQAAKNGIDLEQRGQGLMKLFLRLTEPETLRAADRLLGELPQTGRSKQVAGRSSEFGGYLDGCAGRVDEQAQGRWHRHRNELEARSSRCSLAGRPHQRNRA